MLEKHADDIKRNIEWLKTYLPIMKNHCKVISFDCLGIEQIDPKSILNISNKEYNRLFQGSDTDVTDKDGNITCSTFFMDLPNMQVARMSTAALDKRFDFTGEENISELFRLTTKGW